MLEAKIKDAAQRVFTWLGAHVEKRGGAMSAVVDQGPEPALRVWWRKDASASIIRDAMSLEIGLPRRAINFGVSLRVSDDVQFSVSVPWLSFYVGAGRAPKVVDRLYEHLKLDRYHNLRCGFSVYSSEGGVVMAQGDWLYSDISLLSQQDASAGRNMVTSARSGVVDLTTLLLGKPVTTTVQEVGLDNVPVPLPEGVYYGTGRVQRMETRRARWPFVWDVAHFEVVNVPQGIPTDDGIYGGFDEGVLRSERERGGNRDVFGAVGVLVGKVMSARGGDAKWRPTKRVRRKLPLPADYEASLWWEVREPLTGTWRFCKGGSGTTHAVMANQGYRIDEPPCGYCGAKYGEPCRELPSDPPERCPHYDKREENRL